MDADLQARWSALDTLIGQAAAVTDVAARLTATAALHSAQSNLLAVQAQRDWNTSTAAREAARDAKYDSWRSADNGAVEAYRAAQIAHNAEQRRIAQATLDMLAAQAGKLATPLQERWMELYQAHLKTRLGPAIITSSTPQSVMDDIVSDAVAMTVTSLPLVNAELAKLA